ncbi:unnamed protein product [Durusdinium trenchii]|uniref:Uncharacterized protein n=1 Tax=Durusdinium trenchii TaxID=1381693 RepID=A0ABP0RDV7_9DINO
MSFEVPAQGIAVPAAAADAAEKALETLQRCGVVQLLGGYELQSLDRFQQDGLKKLTEGLQEAPGSEAAA